MHNIMTQKDNLFQSPFHFHGPYLIESDFIVIVIDAINFFLNLPWDFLFSEHCQDFSKADMTGKTEFNSL